MLVEIIFQLISTGTIFNRGLETGFSHMGKVGLFFGVIYKPIGNSGPSFTFILFFSHKLRFFI